jgi:hypothetical protein
MVVLSGMARRRSPPYWVMTVLRGTSHPDLEPVRGAAGGPDAGDDDT